MKGKIKAFETLTIRDISKEEFSSIWAQVTAVVHNTAHDKGFWECYPKDMAERHIICLKLGLINTEVAEAFEEVRSVKLFKKNLAEELADIVIRCMDLAAWCGLDLAGAILNKAAKNEGRPYRHRKVF